MTRRLMVLLLFAPLNLYAQDTGWYAGASLGLSNVGIKQALWADKSTSATTLDTNAVGYQAYVGYHVKPRFAVEGGYLRAADTVFKGFSNGNSTIWTAGLVNGRTQLDGVTIQGVWEWPVRRSRLQLYAKGGMFMWNSLAVYSSTINSTSGSTFVPRFHNDGGTFIGGLGMDFLIWRDWHLRGEAQYTTAQFASRETVGVNIATIGLTHSFP